MWHHCREAHVNYLTGEPPFQLRINCHGFTAMCELRMAAWSYFISRRYHAKIQKHRKKTSAREMPRGYKIFITPEREPPSMFSSPSFFHPARNNGGKTVGEGKACTVGKKENQHFCPTVTATGRGRYKWSWEYVPAAVVFKVPRSISVRLFYAFFPVRARSPVYLSQFNKCVTKEKDAHTSRHDFDEWCLRFTQGHSSLLEL